MITRTFHTILKIVGIIILLIAFLVIPETEPWYYRVTSFDVGLPLILIPKFTKTKKKPLRIKA